MVIAGRIIGWGLFLLGVAVAGFEVITGLIAPQYHVYALGELWFKIHAGSLNGLQAGIQRHVWAWPWDNIIVPILSLPGWLVFMVPGLALILALHQWNRRERRRRR